MFCQYIDVEAYRPAKQRCIDEIIFQTHGGQPIQNTDRLLDALPITIAKYHSQTPSTMHTGITTCLSRQLYHAPHDDQEEENPILRALTKQMANSTPIKPFSQRVDAQCKACGTWGHNQRTCYVTAKLSLVMTYIEKHPKEARKLAQEYLRVNSKSLKQGVVRDLLSLPRVQGDDLPHLVQNLDIPMAEISDSE